MMKRDHATAAVRCTDCGSPDHHLLHNVRYRGAFHRLCTSCVLKLHPGLFCPVCFNLFERSPPLDSIKCSKCPSFSHSACVRPESAAASYVCISCLNPKFLFFDPKPSNKKVRTANGESMLRTIDAKLAKVLLAAAHIAAVSMNRAAATARIEAERKVRESAIARKRARDALERVSLVALKGRESKEVPASVPGVAEQKRKLKGNSAVAAAVAAQKRIQNRKSGGGFMGPLSNVGSRETEKLVGVQPRIPVQRPLNNGLASEEGKDTLKGYVGVSGHQHFQNYGTVDQKKKLGGSSHWQNHVIQEEKEKNPTFCPSVSGNQQHQHSQNSHVIEEDKGN
ncbi:uncharacterized protein LOC131225398 [Magnolia sinica]|uniref:uncharacterized protein LOC131225398 n=1 Tax=Magnolia sinica TaxID=86752 RepID=UPI00265974A6|nr:uncharacterized protein LOC131225398 [Magnolia sinica]